MRTVFDPAPDGVAVAGGRPLLVFLPGAMDTPEDLLREGFVAAVRARGLAVDVLLADAEVGYYTAQTLVEQLHQHVVEPARARGAGPLWLAGISIGGMGALLYTQRHPDQVAGLVALAPYLGPRNISREIERAGGLAAWPLPPASTDAAAIEAGDGDRLLWRWLQGYAHAASPATHPSLYWGHGLDDRFAHGHRVVAAGLPPSRVFSTPGGHVWPVWRTLWDQILAVLPWPRLDARRNDER